MPGLPHTVEPEICERKIREYLLAPDHPQGSSKARYFLAHGFELQAWQVLADALREHGMTRELHGERHSDFGTKYEVVCSIATPDGRDPCIISVWIAERAGRPRLVTAYPARVAR